MRFKKLLRILSLFLLLIVLVVFFCNLAIDKAAEGKLYSNVDSIPYNKVGLLLGTAKFLASGYTNYYYQYRIDAAVQLYKARKVSYFVISGDNSRKDYNEPSLMRSDLIAQGVDSTHIYLDYAGFRTFDSMVRLREIFGQQSATIISQPFHNERALYIASKEGIAAVGFNAKDVNARAGLKVQLREKLARTKVFLDYLFGNSPKFLGEKISIP
ncbi:MAG TPA: ElyC/SanA/YdcF family protein [Flavisolibacter sp.]|nr:ElyC/SanA/YdcF family protein [Flavisolibacter sp.]